MEKKDTNPYLHETYILVGKTEKKIHGPLNGDVC